MADVYAQWLGSRFDDDDTWTKLGVIVDVDPTSPDVVTIDYPDLGMTVAYAVLPGQTAAEVLEAYHRARAESVRAAKRAGL